MHALLRALWLPKGSSKADRQTSAPQSAHGRSRVAKHYLFALSKFRRPWTFSTSNKIPRYSLETYLAGLPPSSLRNASSTFRHFAKVLPGMTPRCTSLSHTHLRWPGPDQLQQCIIGQRSSPTLFLSHLSRLSPWASNVSKGPLESASSLSKKTCRYAIVSSATML